MKCYTENIPVFILKGKDKVDFLQRLSTNDIGNLGDSGSVRSILLNERGRIIDFVTLLKLNDNLLILATIGNEIRLKEHLEKFIVMDDVSFSVEQVKKHTFIKENNNEFDEIKELNLIDGNYYFTDSYRFRKIIGLIYNENSTFLKNKKLTCEPLTGESFVNFAIDNFYIYSVNELNENINPLECHLKDFISFNKGCYIGQEVIARLDSQAKIPKVMVRINSDFILSKNDKIFSNIKEVETECGFISSVVAFNGQFKGFGFIRENNLSDTLNYYINKDKTKIISINKLN